MRHLRPASMFAAAFACAAAISLALPSAPVAAAERAIVLEVNGAIGPPIADYIAHELDAARSSGARLVILRMNTPGGLDTSMRQIISAVLASPVPVVTYVAPNGARAASAGTYIAYARAIAAMAPGTNIGAATPVQFGGNPLFPSDQKSQKDQKDAKPGESADTEARKSALHAVDEACAFADQRLVLAARAPGVFHLERRDRRHCAVVALTPQPPQEGALQ